MCPSQPRGWPAGRGDGSRLWLHRALLGGAQGAPRLPLGSLIPQARPQPPRTLPSQGQEQNDHCGTGHCSLVAPKPHMPGGPAAKPGLDGVRRARVQWGPGIRAPPAWAAGPWGSCRPALGGTWKEGLGRRGVWRGSGGRSRGQAEGLCLPPSLSLPTSYDFGLTHAQFSVGTSGQGPGSRGGTTSLGSWRCPCRRGVGEAKFKTVA